mmetsp:Transcript_35503/g.35155  ORF Transcript_35503/g.35155 Transcript_35503/m.35155 type:complete len:140 (+) Transcript_35503:193-612(+)
MHFRAGLLGVAQLGASVILISIQAFLYMVPLGMSLMASSLIGNNLGASKPNIARTYFKVIIIIVTIIGFFFSLSLISFRSQIADIFTTDPNIKHYMIITLPIMAAMIFPDGIQCALFGIMKAMGYQAYGMPISFVGYWL